MIAFSAGLSKTGTTSIHQAVMELGLSSLHWSPENFEDIILNQTENPDWRRFDDVDFVCDIPAACFHREILSAYPDSKVILTIRDEESWSKSMKVHIPHVNYFWKNRGNQSRVDQSKLLHKYAYGSEEFHPYFYRKRFREHNEEILRMYPNCLIMNIIKGDGWEKLCPFLEVPIPDTPFPFKNVKNKIPFA